MASILPFIYLVFIGWLLFALYALGAVFALITLIRLFSKKQYQNVALAIDVLFQALMMLLLFKILHELFVSLKITYFAFALMFFIGHLPIFIIKHVKFSGKIFICMLSSFGAYVFALIIGSYSFGIIITIVIHFLLYQLFLILDKKYNLGFIP
ncbi:MAG: hypothetical protein V1859_09200 [archaeon]